jgi:hypothetical protein
MTPIRQPNPALEWRLEAIDQMHPDLLAKILTSLEGHGIGTGPKDFSIFNQNQLKDLTITMAALLDTLDSMDPNPPIKKRPFS